MDPTPNPPRGHKSVSETHKHYEQTDLSPTNDLIKFAWPPRMSIRTTLAQTENIQVLTFARKRGQRNQSIERSVW